VATGIPRNACCLHKLQKKIVAVRHIIFANAIDKFIGGKAYFPRTGNKGNCRLYCHNIYLQYIYLYVRPSSVGPKERYEIPRNAFSNLDRFLRSDRQPKRTSRYKDTRTRTLTDTQANQTHTQRGSCARMCVCVYVWWCWQLLLLFLFGRAIEWKMLLQTFNTASQAEMKLALTQARKPRHTDRSKIQTQMQMRAHEQMRIQWSLA